MTHLHHVNLVVDDLERMVDFYRDRLGLRCTKRATIQGAWIEAVTALPGVVADVAFLEADAGSTGIELIHYRAPKGTCPSSAAVPNTRGIRHIAFQIERIDELVASLRAAEVTVLGEVQTVPAEQVDYADQTKRIVYCLDPEGNLLELCEFR